MEDLTNEKLISLLKDLNLMDEILATTKEIPTDAGVDISDTQEKYLLIKCLGGSAFTDFIVSSKRKLVLNIHFLGNSYETEPVLASAEPCFNQSFKLYIQNDSKETLSHLL